jgi:hypothetical protein
MLPETREAYLERYASLNFALVPVRGKKPIWDAWEQQFITDKERMKQVFLKQYPDSNIGVVLGPSHLVTLDVDKKHNGLETLEHLEYQHGFQDTLRSITGGGGQRLFYREPDFQVKIDHKFAQGIEILAGNAQTVIPPSIHPETHCVYAWDMIEDELDREHIRQLPLWILERLAERTPVVPTVSPVEKIRHPMRHKSMVSMAGVMREKMAATEEEINAYLQIFNQARCDPPYDAAHVAKIAKSVALYAPKDPRIVAGLAKAYAQLKRNREEEKKFEEEYKPITLAEIQAGNFVAPTVVVNEMFVVGLSLLAGIPKVGKSYLTTQIAIAISTGTPLFGCQEIHRPGRVAYISLEEDGAQSYEKAERLNPTRFPLREVQMYYKCPCLLQGGETVLAGIIERSEPSAMIIDSYRAISTDNGPRDVVAREYASIRALADLAKKTGTAIIMICHSPSITKGIGVTSKIAGTYGNTAAADTIAALYADGDSYVLEGEGRSIRGFRFSLLKRFDEGIGWEMKAKGEDARYSDQRESIFKLLLEEKARGPMSPKEITSSLGMKGDTVRSLLRRMVDAGQIHRTADGKYVPLGDTLHTNVIPFRPRGTN